MTVRATVMLVLIMFMFVTVGLGFWSMHRMAARRSVWRELARGNNWAPVDAVGDAVKLEDGEVEADVHLITDDPPGFETARVVVMLGNELDDTEWLLTGDDDVFVDFEADVDTDGEKLIVELPWDELGREVEEVRKNMTEIRHVARTLVTSIRRIEAGGLHGQGKDSRTGGTRRRHHCRGDRAGRARWQARPGCRR